jgi:hypothetical protein
MGEHPGMIPSRILPILVITLTAVIAPANAEPAAPAKGPAEEKVADDLQAKLLGSWRFKRNDGGVSADGITIYKNDGTWISKGTLVLDDEKMDCETAGKWKLDGKKLSFEVTKSNLPDLMEVGMKWTETVLSITDTEFR